MTSFTILPREFKIGKAKAELESCYFHLGTEKEGKDFVSRTLGFDSKTNKWDLMIEIFEPEYILRNTKSSFQVLFNEFVSEAKDSDNMEIDVQYRINHDITRKSLELPVPFWSVSWPGGMDGTQFLQLRKEFTSVQAFIDEIKYLVRSEA